jgi:hypothetical protein
VNLPTEKDVKMLNAFNAPPQHVKDVTFMFLLQFGYDKKDLNDWNANKKLLW